MKKIIISFIAIIVLGVSSQASDTTLNNPFPKEPYKEMDRINVLIGQLETDQIYCLAQNIYFESRSDNLAGQIAVTDVVLNRRNSLSYPDTVCDVLYQGKQDSRGNMIRNQCQFSWYCDGKSDNIPNPNTNDAWQLALDLATDMYYNNNWVGITEGSTHYHATYVKPAWAYKFTLVGRIGKHIFYRH